MIRVVNEAGPGVEALPDRWPILLLIWLSGSAVLTFRFFWWQFDYFRRPGPVYHAAFLGVTALIVFSGWLYRRFRPKLARYEFPLFVAIPFGVALMHDARDALVVLMMLLGAYTLGRGLLGLLKLETNFAISIGFGLGVFMTVFSLLGVAGLFYSPIFLGLIFLAVFVFHQQLAALASRITEMQCRWSQADGIIPVWNSLAMVFALVFLACTTAVVIAPSVTFDVLKVHFPAALYYAAEHRIAPLTLSPYSYFPQGMEALMGAAFSLAGQTAARMLPAIFFVLSCLLCYTLARRIGATQSGALMGTVCALSVPFIHWDGSVAKNDLALAFFELASLYCLIRWDEAHERCWLFVASAFLGFGCSTKYTVLYGALPLGAMLCRGCWLDDHRWKTFLSVAMILCVAGLLWPIRACLLTGNPVYPEHLGSGASVQLMTPGLHWQAKVIALFETPWQIFFTSHFFESPLPAPVGIVLVLFAPIWLFVRNKNSIAARYCVFFAIPYLIYWAIIWPELRFAVAPLMLLVILTVAKLETCYLYASAWLKFCFNGALAYSLLFSLSGLMITEINAPQLRFLAGRTSTTEYVRQVLPGYSSLEYVGRLAGARDLVLAVDNCSLAYARIPWNYECMVKDATPIQVRTRLLNQSFHFLLLPERLTGLPWPGFVLTPEYRDIAFSVYRVDRKQP